MLTYIIAESKLEKAIEAAIHAEMNFCWTCNSCTLECSVNFATNRLQPLKIVHIKRQDEQVL